MEYNHLLIRRTSGILTIIINREPKLNALNQETLSEINLALNKAFDDDEVLAIIITGAGQKAFVAGADIAEFKGLTVPEARDLASNAHSKVFNLIANSQKPILAAINGYALGGGLEIALAAHLRIASENAILGLPEVTLGLIPGYGGTQRLTKLVGRGRAIEIILSARKIDAQEAFRIGLVNHVFPQQELLLKAEELLSEILKNSPSAISSAIRAINASDYGFEEGYKTEIFEFSKRFETADFIEGVDAFLEKRPPRFRNRQQ